MVRSAWSRPRPNAVPPCVCPSANVRRFLKEPAYGSLDCGLAKLCVPLDRALGTPDAGTVVARLVGQEHDDLLARCAAELAFCACVRNPPAHWKSPKCAKTCEFCTGFVRDFRRFSRIRPASSRDLLQAIAQSPVNTPHFTSIFGDAVRLIRTILSLRRNA